ncbi:hypothetical protein CN514_12580 [Bacillus sp. AFS001701]|nr:hypothetical protein [Bacillus sp. AFS001701]PET64826.1 hypothetical protein CN514_12580 [Bacillus sp. AFS001701]
MKEKTKSKVVAAILLSLLVLGNSQPIFAETTVSKSIDAQVEDIQDSLAQKVIQEAKSGGDVDISQIVEDSLSTKQKDILAAKAEDIADGIEQSKDDVTYDDRYVNDMMEQASDTYAVITDEIKKAEQSGEKMYTQEQILSITPEEAGVSATDLAQIKSTIVGGLVEVATTEVAFDEADVNNEVVAGFETIKDIKDIKIPLSMLQPEKIDEKDGSISYAGYPGCVDNNGYGYKSFIGSDCWVPFMYYVNYCVRDEANKVNKAIPRYCVYNKQNCSWIIGHSKYGHAHSAWTKAWLT